MNGKEIDSKSVIVLSLDKNKFLRNCSIRICAGFIKTINRTERTSCYKAIVAKRFLLSFFDY